MVRGYHEIVVATSIRIIVNLQLVRGHFEQLFGHFPFQIGVQIHLHGQPLELRVLANRFNVANCQTDQQVHQQDGHQNDEDDQEEQWGDHLNLFNHNWLVRTLNGSQEGANEVHFAQHHGAHTNHGEDGQAESFARTNLGRTNETLKHGKDRILTTSNLANKT